MCGHFIMVTRDALDDIVREVEMNRAYNPMPDWPAVRQSAYPGTEAPLIVFDEGALKPSLMKWGFEVAWSKGVIFNTRSETALKPGGMWAESVNRRRCIVPTLGFFEPHRSEVFASPRTGKQIKQPYLFTMPGSPLFFLAGVFEAGRFSLMTTEPNATVAPVHDRMPLALAQNEATTWLSGDFTSLFDRRATPLVAQKAAQ